MRNWLINVRKEKGLTQAEVASESYIDRTFYTQIEKGTRNPSIEVAKKIGDRLGFNPTIFFADYLSEPFELALKNAPIIIAHCDLELRYTWIFNPHVDFSTVSIIGKRDDELDLNNGVLELMEIKRESILKGVPIRREINFPLSDGQITYDVFCEPLRNHLGEIIGAVTASTDVSHYKK